MDKYQLCKLLDGFIQDEKKGAEEYRHFAREIEDFLNVKHSEEVEHLLFISSQENGHASYFQKLYDEHCEGGNNMPFHTRNNQWQDGTRKPVRPLPKSLMKPTRETTDMMKAQKMYNDLKQKGKDLMYIRSELKNNFPQDIVDAVMTHGSK